MPRAELAEFLGRHRDSLELNEPLNNLILGTLARAEGNPSAVRLWSLGEGPACAVQVPPRYVFLGDLSESQAWQLSEDLRGLDYFGCVGSNGNAERLVNALAERGVRMELSVPQQLHVLEQAPVFPFCAGAGREKSPQDLVEFAQLYQAFCQEALPTETPLSREVIEASFHERPIYFWEVDGELVAMSARTRVTKTGANLSWVYTRPSHRGRGYGGAITAFAAARAFSEGYKTVFLYTDRRNPHSNRAYQKVGFRAVAEGASYDMSPSQLLPVRPEDESTVTNYLLTKAETSQFLLNALSMYGPVLGEHRNSGNFYWLRGQEGIEGVFCLTQRGNVLVQGNARNFSQILVQIAREGLPVKGFIGPWEIVELLADGWRKRDVSFRPAFESKEILYRKDLTSPAGVPDSRVRLMRESEFEQWDLFSSAYNAEVGLPNQLSTEQRKSEFKRAVGDKSMWGLFEGEKLLSRAALNSKSPGMGQVGAVFTPPEQRKRGYAKAVMEGLLRDCRELHSHHCSILFTGQTDLPAQKLYESLGYRRVGYFGLVLS